MVCAASKRFSQGTLWLEWGYSIPSLRRVARKGTGWMHELPLTSMNPRVSGLELHWWMLKMQALDKLIAGSDMWVSLWGEKKSTNYLLCTFPLLPTPQPSASSYFCTHLTLSVFFQTCINKLERQFLLALAIFSWWIYPWNVWVKHISLKTIASGGMMIQELWGQKWRKQERNREKALKNL